VGYSAYLRRIKRADERTRTADLESHYELACGYPRAYYRVSVRSSLKPRCRPLERRPSQRVPTRTNPVAVPLQYAEGAVVMFSGLPRVAAYCVPVGARVVSGELRSWWLTRPRSLCRPEIADARGSAESTRRSPDERLPHPSTLPHSIQKDGYPFRANICSVDQHA
jgi:hypothetical protein